MKKNKINSGYFFIAFGEKYIEEACNLVRLLRKFEDTYPASILCDINEVDIIKSKQLFDKVIPFNFDNEFSKLDRTAFEKFGGTPKILMSEYLPYDEIIYTDTDVLLQCNPKNLWNYFRNFDQPVVCMGAPVDAGDPLCINVANHCNKNIYDVVCTHSGILYFNKTNEKFDLFSETLKYFWKNYDLYGLNIRVFRNGRADEHALLATINKLNLKCANGNTHPIMTHNYHRNIELPSKIVTGGYMHNVSSILESSPPFIHMFKEHFEDYNILYNRLINM